jgi:hypothetical protein
VAWKQLRKVAASTPDDLTRPTRVSRDPEQQGGDHGDAFGSDRPDEGRKDLEACEVVASGCAASLHVASRTPQIDAWPAATRSMAVAVIHATATRSIQDKVSQDRMATVRGRGYRLTQPDQPE